MKMLGVTHVTHPVLNVSNELYFHSRIYSFYFPWHDGQMHMETTDAMHQLD